MTWVRSSARATVLLIALSSPTWATVGRTCADTPDGCAKGFGTLAYVVSTCTVVGTGQIGTQELRIHRSGLDPISVLRHADPEPLGDSAGLCNIVGRNHLGTASPIAGVFHRLGVLPNGKGVVFEVTNAFQLLAGETPLSPEQQGIFYVRADGTGLRRLAPPSRDSVYRLFVSGGVAAAEVQTRIAFSPDSRLVAFTDLGPGNDGVETEQLFTIDLGTGERRQLTQLNAAEPPRPGRKPIETFFFADLERLLFEHVVGETRVPMVIQADGTRLRPQFIPPGLSFEGGTRVVASIRRSGLRFGMYGVAFEGPPANAHLLPDFGPGQELFAVFADRYPVQLTNYHYGDTALVGVRPRDVLHMASADPLGDNPFHNCNLFRVSPFGRGLRQVTNFDQGRPSEEGCQIGALPGCGIRQVNQFESDASRAMVFYSDCDPFGTNPNGSQIFTVRWNGSGLRQLTHTRGTTMAADGSILEVEIPGPVARGGPS